MYLAEINVYPIKGMGAVQLKEAKVLQSGLEWDRRWLLVDDDHIFVSQRTVPQLATFRVEIEAKSLVVYTLQNPEDKLKIPFEPDTDKQITCDLWEEAIPSIVYSDEINAWFSEKLKITCSLVKMTNDQARNKDLGEDLFVSDLNYADGYPLLALSRESVRHISREIGQDIDIRQFRANLIFDESQAYEEDNMKAFHIGEVKLAMVKPCKRCLVIGIDQDTGESSKEPTRYLSKNRKVDQYIHFGMNAAIWKEGTINVGEKVK